MTTRQMKLSIIPFEKIINNEKIIESRLYDEKRQQINPGDQIEFTCNDQPNRKALTLVKALYRYTNFESLFSDFPLKYFGNTLKEELLQEIEKFYSKEEQNKYGVVGIKIELLK